MELRSTTGRVVAAAALVFGGLGLAACGDDDGGEIRNLNEETAVPSGSGAPSGSGSASTGGSVSGSVSGSASTATEEPSTSPSGGSASTTGSESGSPSQ